MFPLTGLFHEVVVVFTNASGDTGGRKLRLQALHFALMFKSETIELALVRSMLRLEDLYPAAGRGLRPSVLIAELATVTARVLQLVPQFRYGVSQLQLCVTSNHLRGNCLTAQVAYLDLHEAHCLCSGRLPGQGVFYQFFHGTGTSIAQLQCRSRLGLLPSALVKSEGVVLDVCSKFR